MPRDDSYIELMEPDLLDFNTLVENYREKLAGPTKNKEQPELEIQF